MANLWLCGKMHGLHVSCRPYMVEQINRRTMSSGKWSISGNRLLLHFAASTAHPRAAGMTTPLIVTDISPKNMHTQFLKGDTRKHLWERIR